jgi:hypothetical protein
LAAAFRGIRQVPRLICPRPISTLPSSASRTRQSQPSVVGQLARAWPRFLTGDAAFDRRVGESGWQLQRGDVQLEGVQQLADNQPARLSAVIS